MLRHCNELLHHGQPSCTFTAVIERAAYPLDEASRLLGGISRGTLYNMSARGEIRLVKLGRRTLVPRSEIERLTTITTERPTDETDST
jgi:excisionase family DNA binding protein